MLSGLQIEELDLLVLRPQYDIPARMNCVDGD